MEALLKKLAEIPGPSGQEQKVKEALIEELRPYCRELREDPFGNLVAKTGAAEGYAMGILAHMDEVGLIVTRISERGLISFEDALPKRGHCSRRK